MRYVLAIVVSLWALPVSAGNDEYRWELIDQLRSSMVADLLINAPPHINRRLFIDAAKQLEESERYRTDP